jgi:hypothetical protein
MVDLEKKVSDYRRGDRFLIQYLINYESEPEQVLKDNLTYLEMMYFIE